MSTPQTPTWSAAQAGILGTAGATAASAQINQLLGTHAAGVVYSGSPIVSPVNNALAPWSLQLSTQDVDQPFTMSGTALSRVTVPLLAVGTGADLLVSLCADNGSGQPGTVITQTRLPASWIRQLSAVTSLSEPSSAAPLLELTNNPLATAPFNALAFGPFASVTWTPPAIQQSGSGLEPAVASLGDYLVLVGGLSILAGPVVNNVFTITGAAGSALSNAVAQPGYPVAVADNSVCFSTDPTSGDVTLVGAGGGTGSASIANAYTATFDPVTGTVGTWTAQADLPTELAQNAIVASGGYVYTLGGYDGSANSTVTYFAQVENGQIAAWSSTTPLPEPSSAPGGVDGAVINGFAIVRYFGTAQRMLYATATPNGLGPWIPMATAGNSSSDGAPNNPVIPVGTYGLIFNDLANNYHTIGFTQNGPDTQWLTGPAYNSLSGWQIVAPATAGTWQLFGVGTSGAIGPGNYWTAPINLTPRISIPLPTVGLTNGGTYHVLLQQQGGDLNNYLRLSTDVDALPGNPTLLTSARAAYGWTAATPSGTAVPIQVFVNPAVRTAGQMPLHTWEDNGARVTTTVQATTPDQRLLGLCVATQMQLGINQNQGFETGTAPWTPTNCTLVQSTAQAYGGPHSGLVTPNGTSSQVYISSENLPCLPGQSVTAACWVYSPLGASSGVFGLSINWFASTSAGGGYLSTTSIPATTIPAATWTFVENVATAPASAYQWTINPTENGTPPASQTFYLGEAWGFPTYVGAQQSGVYEYGHAPGTTWPLVSVTQLA